VLLVERGEIGAVLKLLAPRFKAALGSDRLRVHIPPMARFTLPKNSEAGVPAH